MITIQRALELGKLVFGLPSEQEENQGVHHLIRKGRVQLITNARDILEEMNLPASRPIPAEKITQLNLTLPVKKTTIPQSTNQRPPIVQAPQNLNLKPEELTVLSYLSSGEFRSVDYLVEKSELSMPKFNATLLTLQLKKLITKNSAGEIAQT